MTFGDILLIALVGAAFIAALVFIFKNGGFSGGCDGNCAGCMSRCDQYDEKKPGSGG